VSRSALRSTQARVQWAPGVLSRGYSAAGRDSPPLVLRSKISWSYTSSSPKRLHGVQWDCFTFDFYVYKVKNVWLSLVIPSYKVTVLIGCVCLQCPSTMSYIKSRDHYSWRVAAVQYAREGVTSWHACCVLNNGCRHCWVEVDTTNHFAIRFVWIGLQLRPGLRYLFFLVQVKERREVRPLEIPAQAFLEQQPLCQVSLFQELSYINKSCPTTRHTGAKGERKYSSCSLLTSTLEGVWSASRLDRALPLERTHSADCKGGRVSPRADLDTAVRGKSLTSAGIEPRSSSPLPDTVLSYPGSKLDSYSTYVYVLLSTKNIDTGA
jgi:hypothetical protein